MKFLPTIIYIFIHFVVYGQPSEWDIESLKAKKVREVRIIIEVPKTNPEHPFMLWWQGSFGKDGKIIESNCKTCIGRTHHQVNSTDLIKKYSYHQGRLAKIDKLGFEESVISYTYDTIKARILETTADKHGQRTSVAIEYLDKMGRRIQLWQIEFDRAYEFGDSVAQVFFDKTEWEYHNQESFTQTYNSDELVNMGSNISKSDFSIFQTSFDIDEIESIIKTTDLSFLKPWSRVRTEMNKDKIFQHNVDSKTGTTYFRGQSGLIEKEEKVIATKLMTFIYQYSYYN